MTDKLEQSQSKVNNSDQAVWVAQIERACNVSLCGRTDVTASELHAIHARSLDAFYAEQLAHLSLSSDSAIFNSLCNLYPVLSDYVLIQPDVGEAARLCVHRPKSRRRKSGAYYTPPLITDWMVASAIVPLLSENGRLKTSEELLNLRILDPAVGVGNFLLSAARLLANACVQACGAQHILSMPDAMFQVAERCLFGLDIDSTAVALSRKALEMETGSRGQVACADALRPNPFSDRRFDCILCNPPYVSFYSRQSQQTAADPASVGRKNHYLTFVEAADNWLNAHGRAAFIVPDTIATNQSYADTRRKITPGLGRLVWFQRPIFGDAVVGSVVIVWGRDPSEHFRISKPGTSNEIEHADIDATSIDTRAVLQSTACRWGTEVSSDGLFTKPVSPLDEMAFIKDGINPGPAHIRQRLLVPGDQCGLDTEPCLEGKDITAFRVATPRLAVRCNSDTLSKADNLAGASLRKPWIFHSPKIVYRQTAPRVIAAVDLQGRRTLNSCHNIILREHNEDVLYGLCAYLNSDFFRIYYQASTGETRVSFPQVHIASMKHLLVPKELFDPQSKNMQCIANLSRSLHRDDTDREAHLVQINALIQAIV